MEDFLIIYPQDPSTSFLLGPFQYLKRKLKPATFYEIQPNEESHKQCCLLIAKHKTIIFMGHGSFQKLSGAKNDTYSKDALISYKEIQEFGLKNWILFSCNSNDLLKKCSGAISCGIGFGDLPTDFNDVQGIREFESNAYLNLTEEAINEFKESINWIILTAIGELHEKKLNGFDFFHFLKIIIARRMLDILKDQKNIDQREHAKLLFDMKDNLVLLGKN